MQPIIFISDGTGVLSHIAYSAYDVEHTAYSAYDVEHIAYSAYAVLFISPIAHMITDDKYSLNHDNNINKHHVLCI